MDNFEVIQKAITEFKYLPLQLFLYDGTSYFNTELNIVLNNNGLNKLELIKSKQLEKVKKLL